MRQWNAARAEGFRLGFLLALGIPAIGVAATQPPGISADPSRATYSDVRTFLHQLAAQHPSTTRLISLGTSDSGEAIEGIAVGNGPVKNMVVSTHHGNEYGATEVARGFAASVVENPIQGQTVYVIPVLNITGYNGKQREEKGGDQSYHDPNRDYPGPCGTEGPHLLEVDRCFGQVRGSREDHGVGHAPYLFSGSCIPLGDFHSGSVDPL